MPMLWEPVSAAVRRDPAGGHVSATPDSLQRRPDARRKRSRIPARSILRCLVDRKSAPLQTKSTPAALASRRRRNNNAA